MFLQPEHRSGHRSKGKRVGPKGERNPNAAKRRICVPSNTCVFRSIVTGDSGRIVTGFGPRAGISGHDESEWAVTMDRNTHAARGATGSVTRHDNGQGLFDRLCLADCRANELADRPKAKHCGPKGTTPIQLQTLWGLVGTREMNTMARRMVSVLATLRLMAACPVSFSNLEKDRDLEQETQ